MNSSNLKVPLWAFVLIDLVLIGAAVMIVHDSASPLPVASAAWAAGCVIAGALILFVKLVLDIERQKNETLDERQRALEALARTVAASAEQISIAASGLHQIADLTQKNLKHAEQLPHKLHEKIAEFQSQLANLNDAEKDELEKELAELRSADSERLQSVSDKIARSTAEWVKLEAATQQHLTSAGEAIAKLSRGTADAIGKAQAAAEQALSHARVEAAKSLGDSSAAALKAIEAAKLAAFSEFTAKIETSLGRFDEKLLRIESAAAKLGANAQRVNRAPAEPAAAPATVAHAEASAPAESTPPAVVPVEPAPAAADVTPLPAAKSAEAPGAASAEASAAPKRTRKPRREEPVAVAPTDGDRAIASVEEPAPVPPEKIPEVAPVAPTTAEPFVVHVAEVSAAGTMASPVLAPPPADAAPAAQPAAGPAEGPSPEAAKPARKRAARKPEPEAEPEPSLPLDDAPGQAGAGVVERVLSSDGATRLLVTAYIGIGNRLFIRGEGGGLTWDKGVPLQFVSIGKWRWETNDAANPVRFKLFKNDEIECTALGAQDLEPGHQQEVMAAF